jgi:hypothetical protein
MTAPITWTKIHMHLLLQWGLDCQVTGMVVALESTGSAVAVGTAGAAAPALQSSAGGYCFGTSNPAGNSPLTRSEENT